MPKSRSSNHRYLSSALGIALSFFVFFVFPKVVFAQNMEAKPVARLITGTINDPRARRLSEPTATFVPVNKSLSPSLDDATPIERRAFEQTNLIRRKHGLQPFVWDSELCRLARAHSENMGRLKFFSHSTPDGHHLKARARNAGIRYVVIAENIAFNMGYDDPGGFAVERWMVSPGHRANILYAGFEAMAVGTFVAPDGSVFLTQTFITRSPQ